MAAIEININEIIIVGTLFVIFGIFLLFDLFKRNEKYSYLAYLVAVIPANAIWGLGYDPLFAFLILFILWDITLLRDTIGVYLKKEKDINEILLYLTLSILIQLIVSAILPEVNEDLKLYVDKISFFWFPDIHSTTFTESIVLGFKISATLLILLIIIPLIIDIKDEDVPLPVFIIYIGIFIIPFLYLSYIWVPEAMGVLTFLFSVILFFILLLITRSGKESK